jgi:S-adenosylmethionine decarboxylase
MQYLPGKHIIATLQTSRTDLITTFAGFQQTLDQLIATHNLHKLGEVYHNFSPAGFTAVACLSESHISIHTWPEYGKINLDIYLSNYQRNNDGTVQAIFESVVAFFEATISHEQTITR